MDELFDELLSNNCLELQDKFYRHLSLCCSDNEDNLELLIERTWELIEKQMLSKDILYFYLLVNKNFKLLEKWLHWDKTQLLYEIKDPNFLYDYTVYTKKHWFDGSFKNCEYIVNDLLPKEVKEKLLYLQLINITYDSSTEKFNMSTLKNLLRTLEDKNINNFWIYYRNEINFILRTVEFCKNLERSANEYQLLNSSAQKSILEVAFQHIDLYKNHLELEKFLLEIGEIDIPHNEDIIQQCEVLASFSVLIEFLKLIIPNSEKNRDINVKDVIDDVGRRLLDIKSYRLQIEFLQLIFCTAFIKVEEVFTLEAVNSDKSPNSIFLCNEKEIRIILFALKHLIDEIKFRKLYVNGSEEFNKMNDLHKVVTDATWRLDLIVNLKNSSKCETKLLYYMLAEPESLINMCLKYLDFSRASQVLKIFNLESSSLAKEILFTEKLLELKETFRRIIKMRELSQTSPNITMTNVNLQYDNVTEEFFQNNPATISKEYEEIINQHIERYPFLEHYRNDSQLFMNILDLAITQTETVEDSKALLHLALKYNTLCSRESDFSMFSKKILTLFNEIVASNYNLYLSDILQDPGINLDLNLFLKEDNFYNNLEKLWDEFQKSVAIEEPGIFNKDHISHKSFQKINKLCIDYLEDKSTKETGELNKYLQKIYNYLKAFSKVLYIEEDSSELISNAKNTSYFDLLFHNRSELMGKLLFQQNLDPTEFEKYFGKLKLDFLYHVTGNCFPTINLYAAENISEEELYPENDLYTPNKAVITYIQKRNWLLALILNEMYTVPDVDIDVSGSRIQNFLNYLKLPKIENLQAVFKSNEIITALQNEISFQKVHDYIYAEIGSQDASSSSQTSHSSGSLESAEEIYEDKLKTPNWKKLYGIIDSIPENQIKKQANFILLRDMILSNLVKDAFECEYYKYTLEICSRNLRTDLLLENMKFWPEDFCIHIIKSELSRFDQEHDDRIDELNVWLKHIQHSKKVMNLLNISSWANMYNMCIHQPKEVIYKLLASKEINLLLEFLDLHEVSNNMLLCIDEEFLEKVFDANISLMSIHKLLNLIPFEHSMKLCQNLLRRLKNVNQLQFIANYLCENTSDLNLTRVILSLDMLSVFTSNDFDQQLLLLLEDPLGIIEVLIMNTKLDKLTAVLDILKSKIPVTDFNEENVSVEKIDELLRSYAEKSLDFRVITQPNPRLLRTPDHKLLQSLDSINLDPSNKAFTMPEAVPTKQEWVLNSDVIECMCCTSVYFSMFNRRHHCRRCGRVVCGSCSKKKMIVPSYGDILVRVCSDCYDQTFKDSSVSDETRSTKSAMDDYWILTDDPEHNRIVREEFSYEFAPSVSLCLSLMKLHSKNEEYSKFLLEQCEILLQLIIPAQEPVQEIDYLLIIRMLKSLGMAAKMASQDCSLQYGSSADRILSQAELVGLLAERGCLNLLPTTGIMSFIDAITLRRLTDKLLEREQWKLALEVSTKAGLDKSGVFVAWGKSCLKAGNLAMAREKFSKCLDKNAKHESGYYQYETSSVKSITNPPLLNEIIKILESKKEKIDEDLVMTLDHQKLLASTLTLNQSITSMSQSEGSIFILNKLKNLKNVEMGNYPVQKPKEKKTGRKLEGFIYDECVYYLKKYGTPVSLAEFHIKYRNFDKALSFIKSMDSGVNKPNQKLLGPDIFVAIYMICLKDGSIEKLQICMSEMDSTLNMWKDHLMQTCYHLKRQNYLNSLYQLQQYMGDYVRAAMTCVRFYEEKALSYTDLLKNSHFLLKSEEHFKQAEDQDQWVEVSTVKDDLTESKPIFEEKSISSPMIKKLSHEEIEKHTATLQMQIEVTEFLASCEEDNVLPMQIFLEIYPNKDNLPMHKMNIPTLFGSPEERKYLAVLCIICGKTVEEGFTLSLRLINKFELKPVKIYNEAGRYFAQTKKYSAIAELVNCIQKASDGSDKLVNDMCDDMLILTVATLNKSNASDANVEDLIKLITDKSAKISAYIEAKQLKTAYFLATKYKKIVDIRRIMREAEMLNQLNIKLLCQKALQRYSQSPASSTSHNQ